MTRKSARFWTRLISGPGNIIVTQQHKLEALAIALLEYETIERPQFEALMI